MKKTSQELKITETTCCRLGCCRKKAAVLSGVVLVAVGLAFGACRWACCGTRTVVIDLDRIQQEATVYRSILEQQKGYEEKLQAELAVEAGALEKEEKDLVAKKEKMKEAEFQKKVAALQKKAAELQAKYQFRYQQVGLASQLAAEQVRVPVREILERVAKKAGAGVVLNKAVTVYSGKKADMTDSFIRALNEEVKPIGYPNPETLNPRMRGQ